MDFNENNIDKFLEDVSISLGNSKDIETSSLENIPLYNNECIYLVDFTKNKIIYHRGIQNVLGYSDSDISLKLILNSLHPDDSESVSRIGKAALLYCMDNPDNAQSSELLMSYRRRKKDGTYIKVLSKSCIYFVNDKGDLTGGLTKISDVNFMDSSDAVKWSFEIDHLDKEVFKEHVYSSYKDFFTTRERQIIVEMAKDLNNREISEKLNISRHTVATHRKHIFKKSNRHNVKDLILFCKNMGII